MLMEIVKSSRHAKLIGSFGENIICNWFSRSGFEVIIADHTGLDIIAYNPATEKRLGVTVKSRTRSRLEGDSVNIFSYQEGQNGHQKLLDACLSFACEPWIAIYIETSKTGYIYLTSLNNYDERYRGKPDKKIDDWKMGERYKEIYRNDPEVKHIRIEFQEINWF